MIISPVELKIWMLRNKIKQSQIAKAIGISQTLVWITVNGRGRNRRVLQWLRENGCPENLLAAGPENR